jgi:hypothetical protein
LVAVAFATGLSAQTPYPQTEKPQPEKKATDTRAGKSLTITGCLREGDEPNTFILANVDASALPRPSTTPSEPAGTAGATTTTVRLIGSGDVNLKAHVGHKIEVTGMLVPQGQAAAKRPTGTAGTPTETTDTTARERGSDKSKEHKLNVRSIKHVSETCTM